MNFMLALVSDSVHNFNSGACDAMKKAKKNARSKTVLVRVPRSKVVIDGAGNVKIKMPRRRRAKANPRRETLTKVKKRHVLEERRKRADDLGLTGMTRSLYMKYGRY
jgi:hypothetical protein